MKIVLGNQFKNEQSRIVEWLCYYRDRGITDFVLCNDHSTDDSIKKIHSVEGINCTLLNSVCQPSTFNNSKQTDYYAGNCAVAISISKNFKHIHEKVLKIYGNNVILGFFDVDEFLLGQTKNLSEEIINITSNYMMTSICGFDVDSDLFSLDEDIGVLKQTTRSMSVKNRHLSTRKSVIKSFLNLNKDEQNHFCSINPDDCNNSGGYAHTGGLDRVKAFDVPPYKPGVEDYGGHQPIVPSNENGEWHSPNKKWHLAPPKKLKYLHYRSSKKDTTINKKLFDEDYTIP